MNIATKEDRDPTEKHASDLVSNWFKTHPNILSHVSVEKNRTWQRVDVDWLVTMTTGQLVKVEVKGDRYRTGNFFLETTSNVGKGTPGCILYSAADYLFYCFVKIPRLYILPLPELRAWFIKNLHRYKDVPTGTKVGEGGYTTVGKVVPIRHITGLKLDGAKTVQLTQLPEYVENGTI